MSQNTYEFAVGDITCIAAADGHFNYPLRTFFANVEPDELRPMLRQRGLPEAHVTTPYTCLLIVSEGERILVDAGAGAKASISAALFPSVDNRDALTGRLLPNLQAAGIEAGDVDKVIITHAHPDHVGGMLDAEGRPVYANARYYMARAEWQFWTSPAAVEQAPSALVHIARRNLLPLAERLTFVDDGDEIAPGVHAVDATGHTPGHIAVAVASGGQRLLHISDLALHPLHLENPTWFPALDIAPARAAASRARLLNQAAAQGTRLFAHHFAPFPALGTVQKATAGWQWRPLQP